MTDAEAMAALSRGEIAALDSLVVRHSDRAQRLAFGVLRDPWLMSVKWYGAPKTHQATVNGFNVIWDGADETSVDMVAFQTTSGTLVYMTSGPDATTGPAPGVGRALSLDAYVELMEGMS